LSFAQARPVSGHRGTGSSASLEGTAAVDKELAQILPPLITGAALILGAVLLIRLCLSVWARRRSLRDSPTLPVQPVFPQPPRHERLQDPGYLGKINEANNSDPSQ